MSASVQTKQKFIPDVTAIADTELETFEGAKPLTEHLFIVHNDDAAALTVNIQGAIGLPGDMAVDSEMWSDDPDGSPVAVAAGATTAFKAINFPARRVRLNLSTGGSIDAQVFYSGSHS